MELDRRIWSDSYHALDNDTRLDMLILLEESGQLTYTDLKNRLKISDEKLDYHLDVLFNAKLIRTEYAKEEPLDKLIRKYGRENVKEEEKSKFVKITFINPRKHFYYKLTERGKKILQELNS